MNRKRFRFLSPVLGLTLGTFCFGGLAHAQEGAFEEAPPAEASELPNGQNVKVGSFGQIDIHVKELDITKVLQLLSIQGQRNIIATKDVSGTVSADLYQVDFYDALDAILEPNGFGYLEKGNFIYVHTREYLEAQAEATRVAKSEVVKLNYITAADASTFVSPLLSASGTISASGAVAEGYQASLSNQGANSNAQGEILMIRDFEENVEEIKSVIALLDTRPKQVEVAATILEAKLTENNAFGVDINAIIDLDFADFANPLGSVDDILNGDGPAVGTDQGQAIQTTPGQVGSGESTFKVGFLSNNINVFVKALDAVTDTTVISKPRIVALNRMPASLLVGERLGYLSTQQTETTTTQTVEYLEVGTELKFRAYISEDDFIRLELNPQVSDGSTSLVGGNVIPDETTSELNTNVIVRNGQTVVLGGLFKEDTQSTRRQVPGLGDIPLLGYGFRGQEDTVNRTEVIFLITPTIMKDEAMVNVGADAAESIELARLGAKENLLPFARTKMTANAMRDAHRAMRDGDKEKALWNVNMALHLDPTMVEALRMKQQLTGETLYVHDRSLLKHAADQAIDASLPMEDVLDDAASEEDPIASAFEPVSADTEEAEGEQAEEADESETETAEVSQEDVDWVELTEQDNEVAEEDDLDDEVEFGKDDEGLDVFEVLEAWEAAEADDATDEESVPESDEPFAPEDDLESAGAETDTDEFDTDK